MALRYNCCPANCRGPMLTSAITAAISALLTWLGIPPGPYIAGVWVGVKILLVGVVALLGWRAAQTRSRVPPHDRRRLTTATFVSHRHGPEVRCRTSAFSSGRLDRDSSSPSRAKYVKRRKRGIPSP